MDTTVELANKVGAAEIISRIVDDLKDEAEQYRKMVMETIEKIMGNLGAADIDHKLEEQLIDGILYAFQEQTTEVRDITLIFVQKVQNVKLYTHSMTHIVFINPFHSGLCDAERFWNSGQCPRKARETVPPADLWYGAVASE